MGTRSGQLHSRPSHKMKAFAFVLLAVAHAKAEAEPYTIGQVAHGFTNGGIITGVSYGHGLVNGVGAYGHHYPYTNVYSGHNYGKREAEAESEAEPYVYNTGVYGHHGVVSTYGHSVVPAVSTVAAAVPAVHSVAAAVPAVSTVAAAPAVHNVASVVPAVNTVAGVHTVNNVVGYPNVYGHYYGKREAEAEPGAEPYVYNTGVYGHHGVVSTYGHGIVPAVSTVAAAVPAVSTVTAGVPAVHNVASVVPAVNTVAGVYPTVRSVNGVVNTVNGVHSGVYYGKREAEAEPSPSA